MFTRIGTEENGNCGLFEVPAGTVVKIEGIPLKLDAPTRLWTNPGNAALIERYAAERANGTYSPVGDAQQGG